MRSRRIASVVVFHSVSFSPRNERQLAKEEKNFRQLSKKKPNSVFVWHPCPYWDQKNASTAGTWRPKAASVPRRTEVSAQHRHQGLQLSLPVQRLGGSEIGAGSQQRNERSIGSPGSRRGRPLSTLRRGTALWPHRCTFAIHQASLASLMYQCGTIELKRTTRTSEKVFKENCLQSLHVRACPCPWLPLVPTQRAPSGPLC